MRCHCNADNGRSCKPIFRTRLIYVYLPTVGCFKFNYAITRAYCTFWHTCTVSYHRAVMPFAAKLTIVWVTSTKILAVQSNVCVFVNSVGIGKYNLNTYKIRLTWNDGDLSNNLRSSCRVTSKNFLYCKL